MLWRVKARQLLEARKRPVNPVMALIARKLAQHQYDSEQVRMAALRSGPESPHWKSWNVIGTRMSVLREIRTAVEKMRQPTPQAVKVLVDRQIEALKIDGESTRMAALATGSESDLWQSFNAIQARIAELLALARDLAGVG